ncbi:MAG: Eco57I restriction-modification methylase domain-containing protein, partial [Candidatus Heimdallarchaeaceae archaeon]
EKEEEIENEKLIEFVSSNIYCYDNNQLALKINELRLLTFIKFVLEEAELRKVNFKAIKTNTLDKEKIKKNNHFDIILINPPFKTYGLRNGQKYSQELKKYLRKEYKTAEYKLPLYPLFMERAIELLKKRGVLGVVSPDSFLLGKYYSKIRKYILNNTTIKEITLLDYEPFEKVTLGRTALTFYMKKNEKEKIYSQIITKKISNYQFLTKKNKTEKKYINNKEKFLNNNLNRFFLFFNEKEEEIVEKWIEKADCKLEDLVTMHTGIRSKIGQKKIISLKKHDENWKKGIISGKQIKAYRLEYKGHWININPDILWSGGYNEEIMEKPKVFIRQTGDRVIACVDKEGYYHLNNIHSLSPKDETVNLYVLALLLNSKESNKIYQILSMEKGRTFAQIDMDFLLKISIPYLSKKEVEKYKFYSLQNER